MNTKLLPRLLILVLSTGTVKARNSETLLFYDGFEENVSNDAKISTIYLSPLVSPGKLDYDIVRDTAGILATFKRDLIVCNIEGQILTGWAYWGVNPGAYTYELFQWPSQLEYFYALEEENRIKLQRSTPWFDFYSASTDTAHMGELIGWFQDARDFYHSLNQFQGIGTLGNFHIRKQDHHLWHCHKTRGAGPELH